MTVGIEINRSTIFKTSKHSQSLPPLTPHHPSQNRTIPLTFRRARVCVCFICFASLRNFGHTRLRHPCLFMNALLALRPAKPLGVHFRHPCLACPSRCTDPLHPHNPRKIANIPRKSPTSLPPLSKGGGLTARHKLLLCNVLLAIHPPFLFTKLFCRQDGGIAPLHLIPLPSHLSFLFNILLATILKLTIDYIVVYHHPPTPFISHCKAPPSAIFPHRFVTL